MKTAIFQMESYTKAMNAKSSLSQYRISSRVEKSTGSGGCAFRLVVFGNIERAGAILFRRGFIKNMPKGKLNG